MEKCFSITANGKSYELYESELKEILSRLNDQERILIYCRYWAYMTIQEIADDFEMEWKEVNERIDLTNLKIRLEIQGRNQHL